MYSGIEALAVLMVIALAINRPAAGQSSIELPSFDVAAVKAGSHPLTPEGYSYLISGRTRRSI
jgi:hypothetical protein